MQKTVHFGWLLAAVMVCLLGWLMFVTNLDAESIWYDEWYTWEISRQGLIGAVNTTATDVHPPLYYLWVSGWMAWTQSDDVFVMRLTSVIPSILAVALCYRIGSDWFRNRWVGLTAAVFLATSGIFIYYTRELRMYPLVALLGMSSWWLLWRYLKGHRRSLVSYGVTVALMLYTYYFMAFMIAVQALVALLFAPRRVGQILLAYGAALLVFVPWLPTVYQQLVLESSRAGRGQTLSLTNIGKFAANQPTNAQTIQQFVQIYTAGQPAFVLLLALMAVGFSVRVWRQPLTTIGLWLLATTLLFFGLNLVIPVYNLRYVLMVVPALALLAGAGAAALPTKMWQRVAMISLVGGVGLITHSAGFLEPKTPQRELMQTLAQHYLPGDRIWYNLNAGAYGSSLQFEADYYRQHVAPNLATDFFVWSAPRDLAERVWDVRPYWITMPDDVKQVLEKSYGVTEEYNLGAYSIRLYEAIPTTRPVIFADLMALSVTLLKQATFTPGQTVRLKTWWRALKAIPLDYSYGLYLRDAKGAVVAQVDNGLMLNDVPTSQWLSKGRVGLSPLELTLPANLPPGDYGLWLAVYYWENPEPLAISTRDDANPVDAGVVRLAQIAVTP